MDLGMLEKEVRYTGRATGRGMQAGVGACSAGRKMVDITIGLGTSRFWRTNTKGILGLMGCERWTFHARYEITSFSFVAIALYRMTPTYWVWSHGFSQRLWTMLSSPYHLVKLFLMA